MNTPLDNVSLDPIPGTSFIPMPKIGQTRKNPAIVGPLPENHWVQSPPISFTPERLYVVALLNGETVTLADKDSAEKLAKFLLTVTPKH